MVQDKTGSSSRIPLQRQQRQGPRDKQVRRVGPIGEIRRAPRLADAFKPRSNSLNALRLALASAVLVSHSWQFVGGEKDPWARLTGGPDVGEMAVDGFFLISGFLIVRSHLNATSTGRYLWHRFLRILPGFWVCLVVTAVVLAPLLYWLERDRLDGYPWTGSDSGLTYVISNAALRMNQFNIGDIRGGQAVDGSLHTLYFEFLCYLLVAALGVIGVLRRHRGVVLAGVGGFLLVAAVDAASGRGSLTDAYTVRFAGIFLIGSVMYLYAERIPISRWLLPPAVALLALSGAVSEAYLVFAPVALGYLLLYAGTSAKLANVGAKRDLSYGIYIYAWPIQLVLIELGVGDWGVAAHAFASIAVTAVAAAISWKLVEAPAMSYKSLPMVSLPGCRAKSGPEPAPAAAGSAGEELPTGQADVGGR